MPPKAERGPPTKRRRTQHHYGKPPPRSSAPHSFSPGSTAGGPAMTRRRVLLLMFVTSASSIPRTLHAGPVGPTTPAASKGPVTWLAGGSTTTCAVRDGGVYCWGHPLGTKELGRSILAPQRVTGLTAVDLVSV